MPPSDDFSFTPLPFSGTARLFPLPNLVMFPHVLQPLHVFEPRYREMVEDALAGDRQIAMALLEPGFESDYEGRPPIAQVACLGQIATHHRLEGGEYNLLLVGLRRIRIVHELPPLRLFREAEALPMEEIDPPESDPEADRLTTALMSRFRAVLPDLSESGDALETLLDREMSLSVLTDVVAYTLDLDVAVKQGLLEETDVLCRARRLVTSLERLAAARSETASRDFPPGFSLN